MQNIEYIELFFSKSYEKTLDKLIRDDKNYIIPYEQLHNYIKNIITVPYQEFINYILNHPLKEKIETKDITQSSSFSACEIEMCKALMFVDNPGLNYLEIGKLFPDYVSHPNDTAYRKYGENQIKTSAHLGLVYEYYKYWYLSCIGYIYQRLSELDREKLLARTILRTPFYYRMMVDLYYHDVASTKYMTTLSRATQLRREGSVCRLLDICIEECRREGIQIHKIIKLSDIPHRPVVYDLFYPMEKVAESQNDNSERSTKKDVVDDVEESNGSDDDDDHLKTIFTKTKPYCVSDFEEWELCKSTRILINEISKYPILSNNETEKLFRRYQNGDKNAYDLLIWSNLAHVINVSRLFKFSGARFEDIFQEGSLGLLNAITNYNLQYHRDFIVYAKIWIYRAIQQSVSNLRDHVKIPPRHIFFHELIRKFCDHFEQLNCIPPSFDDVEIDNRTGSRFLRPIYELYYDLHDIMVPKNDWDSVEDNSLMADHEMLKESEKFELISLVNALPKRTSDILVAYYGLNDEPEMNLEEIAEQYHLTRERVRQITVNGICWIQRYLGLRQDSYNQEKLELMKLRKAKIPGNQFGMKHPDVNETIRIGGKDLLGKGFTDVEKHQARKQAIRTAYERTRTTQSHLIDYSELKLYVLRIMRSLRRPATSTLIANHLSRNPLFNTIGPEHIEDLLSKMTDVGRLANGKFFLMGSSDSAVRTPKLKKRIVSESKQSKSQNHTTRSSEGGWKALALGTLYKYKGPLSAQAIAYLISRDFHTEYPDIDILIRILDSMYEVESKKGKYILKEKLALEEIIEMPPNIYLDGVYYIYMKKIMHIRQAKISGEVIVAKPVLLLAVLDGIGEKEIKNNQIILNNWLEQRYDTLMRCYTQHSNFSRTTPINNPFWHLESDGFWHLTFRRKQIWGITPSTKWLKENISYASFDDELWNMLQNDLLRKQLGEEIIQNKIKK